MRKLAVAPAEFRLQGGLEQREHLAVDIVEGIAEKQQRDQSDHRRPPQGDSLVLLRRLHHSLPVSLPAAIVCSGAYPFGTRRIALMTP